MGAFRAQAGSAVNYRRTHGSYQIELIQKKGLIVAAYGKQMTGSADCRRVRAEQKIEGSNYYINKPRTAFSQEKRLAIYCRRWLWSSGRRSRT